MVEALRYIAAINLRAGTYSGRLYEGESLQARELTDLQLGPQAQAKIKGASYLLEDLVQALINYEKNALPIVYDERGQLEIGRHLYAQIFDTLEPAERRRLRDASVDLRIVTEDEHIARLPWVLLADGSVFLTIAGWSVALSHCFPSKTYELPPSPKLLIVAPQPVGVCDTRAASHIEALETLLSGADPRHVRGQALRVVETWEAFTQAVTDFRPDLVYYYGHGDGNMHTSRLVFASARGKKRMDKPIADVAACLRAMPQGPPLLAYLNCCQGDAGGLLGAGSLLGNALPVVITNRTVAHIDAAQPQALAFWRSVLIDGVAPHQAMATMQRQLLTMGLSFSDERWMAPVLHCHYHAWKANPPLPRQRLGEDPHWRFKLDRVKQFAPVHYQTAQMLQERRPISLAYVWYGQAGQGVDLFHQRLTVELQERLPGIHLYEVIPEWPTVLDRADDAFEEMLCEAFRVNALDKIPGRIRTQNRGASNLQTLVYVRHQPVQSFKLINLTTLRNYLQWWNRCFVPCLKEARVAALLGVSFIVPTPSKFFDTFTEKSGILQLNFQETVINILDEMDRITKKDLLDFLRTHHVKLPASHHDRVLDDILTRTDGNYDLTLEALKDIAARAWAEVEQQTGVGHVQDDADEYLGDSSK